MKLRNKKTGEIISKIDVSQDHEGIWVLENKPRLYHSLAELNEEWEDYSSQEEKWERAVGRAILERLLEKLQSEEMKNSFEDILRQVREKEEQS